MPSIYDLKPAFQRLLRPLVNRLAVTGVRANHVTVAAALLSLAVGALIASVPQQRVLLLLVPLALFLRMALNAIDGMLAREHDMQSRLGVVLNELGDVIADAALYLPLALVAGLSPVLVVIAVVLAVISEMTGVVVVQIGAARRYDGPMGKSDRAFAFGLLCLLLGLGVKPGVWASVFLAVIVLLLLLTIASRVLRALREPNT